MTRKEVRELLPILKAFAEGKNIQDKIDGVTDWVDTDEINLEFEGKKILHRIKPRPKYRPFKTQEECWDEMHKHPDFGWVKCVYIDEIVHINSISSPNIPLCFRLSNVSTNYSADLVFKDYIFTDGTPFGVKEE